jgi:DNA-binding transcriptional regulator LsrR (DeoR family)
LQDLELSLATKAAWLSYVGGLTQEEIAARLLVSRVKVTRLIATAQRAGLVRVFVEGPAADCLELEDRLRRRFGLAFCTVAPNADDAALPLRTLAAAGAHFLHRILEQGAPDEIVGIGHGRTLAAVVDQLPRQPRPGVRFVSLLGSLTRRAAANPYDVIHKLAEITGGEGYFMPAPFFADSLQDKRVLLAQKSLRDVLALAERARLHVVGIGEVGPDAHLLTSAMLTPEEFAALARAGAVGEVLGQFLDAEGRPVAVEVNRRAVAMELGRLRGRDVVAVAGGEGKAAAVAAVLRSGLLTGLITDAATARRLASSPGASGNG